MSSSDFGVSSCKRARLIYDETKVQSELSEDDSGNGFDDGSSVMSVDEGSVQYEIPADGKFYGKVLVMKVFHDLTQVFEENKRSSWTNNQKEVQDDVKEYMHSCDRQELPPFMAIPQKSILEKGKVKRSTVIKMDPVQPNPPSYSWVETPINFITPDSNFLTNIPSAEGHNTQEKLLNEFSEGLVKLYEGHIHGTHHDELVNKLPEDINVLDYIRILMALEKRYTAVVFSETQGAKRGRKEIKKPTTETLQSLYKQQNIDKEVEQMELSDIIVRLVCETTLQMVTPRELRTCYTVMAEKRNSVYQGSSDLNPNLDAHANVFVAPSEALNSYRQLICRMCFTYSCLKHPLILSEAELDAIKISAAKERAKRIHLKGSKFECKFENCWKPKELATASEPLQLDLLLRDSESAKRQEILRTWCPTEMSLCDTYYSSFRDLCFVAFLLQTKDCVQVKEYYKYVMKVSPQPDLDSPVSTEASSGYDSASPDSPKPKKASNSTEQDLLELYTHYPCAHSPGGACTADCPCVKKGWLCEFACTCGKQCKNRKKGCSCTTTCDSTRCPCFVAFRECDPDLCNKCGAHELENENVSCKNVGIQRGLAKEIEVKASKVSGLGAFATCEIPKGEFVAEYTGELISNLEAERRGHVYDFQQCTYLFAISDTILLDATRFGNKTRFINSSKKPNLIVKKVRVRGDIRVAFYARINVKEGEELTFNYNEVLENHKKQYNAHKGKKTSASKK